MRKDEIKGAETESRFLRVCNTKTAKTPSWFIRVKESPIPWDLRGIDAFAYFFPLDGKKRIKVPIQIKSSRAGKEKFIKHYSAYMVENVFVIVVTSNKSDDAIRRELYTELKRIRDAEINFVEFLSATIAKEIPIAAKRRLSSGCNRIKNYRAKTE